MEGMRGIGRMARESGLSVSALRFYDGAGVLGPAHVDVDTGYRWYAPDQLVVARLVAALRRVGMPLPSIREVLDHRHDPDAVDALLDAHLRRLEQGLVDARRVLSSVPALLHPEDPVPTVITLPAARLVAALRAVRFAVDGSGRFPVLGGILLDCTASTVTVVATDRYRLAVATAPVERLEGPPVSVVVPVSFADALADSDTVLDLVVDGGKIAADGVVGELLDEPFPDYRRLLPDESAATTVEIDADTLRAAVAAGGSRPVRRDDDGVEAPATVLALDADGVLSVGARLDGIGVNPEFLLEAVDAGGAGQLRLQLDGALTPIVVRPDTAGVETFSLLMPVRL